MNQDSLNKSPKVQKPASLLYSPAWMERVFRSRHAVEDLLGPERDAGNITSRDYEASLAFLPGYYRYYPFVFTVATTSLILLRTNRWSPRTRQMAAINGGVGGFLLGKFARLSSHYDYVQSLENPAGFKQAIENVQRKTGTRVPEGFIIERIFEPSQTDNPYETQIPENESRLMLPTQQDAVQVPPPMPQTRWDQIRSANNRTVPHSAWDTLRQKYEKESAKTRASKEETAWSDTIDAPPHTTHN